MAYQFENVKLEKGMYGHSGRSFTKVLETLDPSETYKGTAYENLDAFQRQLKRFGIRVRGTGSDTVEKFFSTFESAVLFPEFIARIVRQGIDEANILPSIVATVTNIDAMDSRSIYSVPQAGDKMLADVVEGASLPATTIRTRETDGIALSTFIMLGLGSLFFTIQGIMICVHISVTAGWALVLTNAITTICSVIIFVIKIINDSKKRKR